jgi:hypothetical protein
MRVSSRTTTDGATVANPQVVCLRLSASFGTVLSDTDAEAEPDVTFLKPLIGPVLVRAACWWVVIQVPGRRLHQLA